jgi:hypothetical protein
MGKFAVRRVKQLNGCLRAAKIFVDDVEIGRVRNGETVVFEAPDGFRLAYASMDWAVSPPVEIEIADGRTAAVEVSFCSVWKASRALAGELPYIKMRAATE